MWPPGILPRKVLCLPWAVAPQRAHTQTRIHLDRHQLMTCPGLYLYPGKKKKKRSSLVAQRSRTWRRHCSGEGHCGIHPRPRNLRVPHAQPEKGGGRGGRYLIQKKERGAEKRKQPRAGVRAAGRPSEARDTALLPVPLADGGPGSSLSATVRGQDPPRERESQAQPWGPGREGQGGPRRVRGLGPAAPLVPATSAGQAARPRRALPRLPWAPRT